MSIAIVNGPNFSGRTEYLRRRERGGAYVGPDVASYLSALAPDVAGELDLHLTRGRHSEALAALVDALNLRSLLHRNPFSLSGGQQVAVTVASARALGVSTTILDCAIEQLDHTTRAAFLRWAATDTTTWLLADNRWHELLSPPPVISTVDVFAHQPAQGPLRPVRCLGAKAMPQRVAGRIELYNLRVGYTDAHPVLSDVSIRLDPGLYFLTGPNGAGKSTFAKLLSGVLRPSHGTIVVNGEPSELWRRPGRLVAYHFQDPDMQLFRSTVADELQEVGRGSGDNDRVAEVAEAFGLDAAAHWHPLDLPFTGRKRIALAVALAMDTPWVVLDEPTLSQDLATADALAASAERLVDSGRAVIIITHSQYLRHRLRHARNIRIANRSVFLEGPDDNLHCQASRCSGRDRAS